MNRVYIFRFLFVLFVLCSSFVVGARAQAPDAAPPLPAGMTGSDANDPRAKLAPGLYDAGEAAMGIKHLTLLKKPDAFQLGATDPDAPVVDKTLGILGIGDLTKFPRGMKLVIAGLAFSNSDLAFQGNHLFQGNFYGMNIYDISNPSETKLLTSMVCSGGQGDVSVYKNLMFMSVEMGNGRLDCGPQGFPRRGPGGKQRAFPRRQNLRHYGHQKSQTGRRGPIVPWFAHPYPGGRSER